MAFKSITFEREINGKKFTRVAETAEAAVKFRFDGWREVKAKSSTTSGGSSTGSAKS